MMESFAGSRGTTEKNQHQERGGELPLSAIRPGEHVIVRQLLGGGGFRTRLVSMGIVPGRELEVLSGRPRHPFLVRIGTSRVMIGWGMLDRVLVRRAGQDDEAV